MPSADGPAISPRARAILRDVLSRFAEQIDSVAVFGSRAIGTERPASDIDLVIYGIIDDATVARIWSLFDQSSLAVAVDIVRYVGLPNGSFRRHIDNCAKPLFDRAELLATRESQRTAA